MTPSTILNILRSCSTRLALASLLGPFEIHFLTFILPTPVHWCILWGHWNFRLEFVMPQNHNTHLPNLSHDCDLWKHQLVFRLLLTLEAKDYWTISHCFHRISFCSRVYIHVRSRNALLNITKYMRFMNFGRYSLKCVLELVASTSNAKVPSKASYSTGLSRTSSKT